MREAVITAYSRYQGEYHDLAITLTARALHLDGIDREANH